jgi:hypothetical protein
MKVADDLPDGSITPTPGSPGTPATPGIPGLTIAETSGLGIFGGISGGITGGEIFGGISGGVFGIGIGDIRFGIVGPRSR